MLQRIATIVRMVGLVLALSGGASVLAAPAAPAAPAAKAAKAATADPSGLTVEKVQSLAAEEVERRLPAAPPHLYISYAGRLWGAGERDKAVFWYYAGRLRAQFMQAAAPAKDPSGAPALLASLQEVVGRPINEYAGADPERWAEQLDAVLAWDKATPNGVTSKTQYAAAWNKTRAGLEQFRAQILANTDEIKRQRVENGLGAQGLVEGVYVEERNPKMPAAWPSLTPDSTPADLAGLYKASLPATEALFFTEAPSARTASTLEILADGPDEIVVIARKDEQELARRTIPVHADAGAVVYEQSRSAEPGGELATGSTQETVYLHANAAGELVIERRSLTEGTYAKKPEGPPVRLSYTFWERAARAGAH